MINQENLYTHNGHTFPIDKDNMIFKNPYDKTILPIEIVFNCCCGVSGIHPIQKNPHDKINIDVPIQVNIYMKDENSVDVEIESRVGRKTILKDFPIKNDHHKFLENRLHKMWEKGYLLNDYGLAYYFRYTKYHQIVLIFLGGLNQITQKNHQI